MSAPVRPTPTSMSPADFVTTSNRTGDLDRSSRFSRVQTHSFDSSAVSSINSGSKPKKHHGKLIIIQSAALQGGHAIQRQQHLQDQFLSPDILSRHASVTRNRNATSHTSQECLQVNLIVKGSRKPRVLACDSYILK